MSKTRDDPRPTSPLAWGRRVHDRLPAGDGDRLQRLADLARQTVAAREEERRRLAAELHDVVGTNLATIKLNLSSLAAQLPGDVAERMADIQDQLAETLSGIRELCSSLRPVALEHAGLEAALRAHCVRFSHRTGIAVDCDMSSYGSPRPAATELMLLRIAQEALWNSAKHAAARSIRIAYTPVGSHGRFTIQDDGCGFDPGAIGTAGEPSGMGILNMRERALSADAVFTLESAPGRGTLVAVDV